MIKLSSLSFALVLCAVVVLCPSMVEARKVYTLTLLDGTRVRGRLHQQTSYVVVMRTAYGLMRIPRRAIRRSLPPLPVMVLRPRRVRRRRRSRRYRYRRNPQRKLVGAGVSILTLSYGTFGLLPGLISFAVGSGTPPLELGALLIPFVGPFISAGRVMSRRGERAFASLPLTIGVAQLVGLGLIIGGAMAPKYLRKPSPPRPTKAHPIAACPSTPPQGVTRCVFGSW